MVHSGNDTIGGKCPQAHQSKFAHSENNAGVSNRQQTGVELLTSA